MPRERWDGTAPDGTPGRGPVVPASPGTAVPPRRSQGQRVARPKAARRHLSAGEAAFCAPCKRGGLAGASPGHPRAPHLPTRLMHLLLLIALILSCEQNGGLISPSLHAYCTRSLRDMRRGQRCSEGPIPLSLTYSVNTQEVC